MTKRVVATIVIAGVASIPTIGARQPPGEPPAGRGPVVVPATRHDVSPPLRAIPPGAARPQAQHEMREPGPMRRGRGPSRGIRVDTVVQDYPSAPQIPMPSFTFEGVSNVNDVLPPDANGDVGPNHYVQWVNLSLAVFSKGSATVPPALVYGPVPGNTLWAGFGGPCEATNNGDPIVMYDHLADRWFMSQLAIPNAFFGFVFGPFYQCIAVSATPDPTGPYYRYQFSFSKLNDYPKFALWPDAYYMTINQFQAFSLTWAGQGVVAFDRERMLTGQPASMMYFDLASVDMNLGGMLPGHLAGPAPPNGSPAYFVEVDDDAWGYSADQLQIWQFHADWANPSASTFTGPALLPTAPFDSDMCAYAACVPQPGTTARLDAMSDRLMYRLQYHNFGTHESLVVNHTVDADGADHAGIRWYEVRSPRSAPEIYQQGTYAPDADHRWSGSVAMDRMGNLALGFSVSGAITSPSVRYTGRLATDPPGLMTQGEADIAVGAGSQTHTSGRWGDYSLMALDPVDQCTFWYTQEYYAATSAAGWQTRVGSFAWPSCLPAADADVPRVTIAATTATAREAGPTNGAVTITRSGDLAASVDVHYLVTGTAVPNSDYVALPGAATFAAGEAAVTIPIVPIDDASVEPNETVVVALAGDPAYLVGSPSSAIVTIVSDDLPPDLIVSALAAPAVAGADTTIVVTDTTKNQGTGPSEASATAFYLSTNTLLEPADVPLGSRAVPALAIGASSLGSTTVAIPAGTAAGTYYILAKADAINAIIETQENNNVRNSGPVRVGPDLIVSTMSVPAVGGAGGTLTVVDTTKNQGAGAIAAPSSATAFYLSANAIFDTADRLLGSRTVPALASGATDTASTLLLIPNDTATGSYFVFAKADANNAVVESLETNNTTIAAIRVGPDLIVSTMSVPAVGGAGGTLTVVDTTKNQGAGAIAAPSSATAFYLSANAIFDTADRLLGSRTVPALASGATDTASTPLLIPSDTVTGAYFLFAKADANNAVVESLETNNTAIASIRIGPDLTISAISVSGTAIVGGSVTIADTTKNAGGGAAGASTTRFYVSTNGLLDANDILIGSRDVAPLAGLTSQPGTTVCTIPPGTPTGTFYLIGVADSGNAVTETAEGNNTAIAIIRIANP